MDKPVINTSRFLERDVMTFLSQADLESREIISFGSGKPDERFFGLEEAFTHISHYYDYQRNNGLSESEIFSGMGQYTRVKGVIQEIIKKYWETDLGFENVDKDNIMLTVGAQEAFALALLRLCEQDKHTVLVEDPSYIGMSSLAELNGYDLACVPIDPAGGMYMNRLVEELDNCVAKGKPVKLVYVIPEFQNPTGTDMPLDKRKQLIELANSYDFFILEDNAYGMFRYENERLPCLKELDHHDRVIYVESFSKSVFPSLRVAAMYMTGTVCFNGRDVRLADIVSELKAYITVNTATLDQALLAGVLLKNEYSLTRYNREKVQAIKEKRDTMIFELQRCIDELDLPVSFRIPEGGFFLELKLPFSVDEAQLRTAMRDYGVVFCPMWFFQARDREECHSIRLSFSKPSKEQIVRGLQHLFSFFKTECFDNTYEL